ncbi:carboxylate--amine ligase [Halobacteriales archaeon SW_12_71_31]|nr:MAG: carboxylate--amine ligase [Halobacteriales archaeon SW_12_71_31]
MADPVEGQDPADLPDPSETFTRLGTVGIEEEFFVVDETGRPKGGTDDLVYGREPPAALEDRLDHELFTFVIETQTPTTTVEEVPDELRRVREALVEHAAPDYRIAAAGLHPGARWRELDHAEKPRYRSQLERIQYPQHRNTTAGLHVHVGVDDPDRAVAVADGLRWYMPVLLALSANSPYWNGFDTGLGSARAKVFEALPNTGMPSRFGDMTAFRAFERRMVASDSVRDRGELWYDVRPHTGHGTVEVRAMDAQHDPERVLAFTEAVHALVIDLAERHADGERLPRLRRELLDENRWRALRYGHEASFLRRDGEGTVPLDRAVERLSDRLDLGRLPALLEESGAERQRRHHRQGVDALYESLVL